MTKGLDTQPLSAARKAPRQARARATVAAILEAAGRILQHRGEAALTTAAVARLAGCSIGTLYQYFADCDEILVALADREAGRIVDKTRELMRGVEPWERPAAVRELVRVLIASFATRRGAKRQFELVMVLNARNGGHALTKAFADILVARHSSGVTAAERQAERARAFVLTRGMLGVLRAAALESDDIMDDVAFEDALCLMIETLWKLDRAAPPGPGARPPSPLP